MNTRERVEYEVTALTPLGGQTVYGRVMSAGESLVLEHFPTRAIAVATLREMEREGGWDDVKLIRVSTVTVREQVRP